MNTRAPEDRLKLVTDTGVNLETREVFLSDGMMGAGETQDEEEEEGGSTASTASWIFPALRELDRISAEPITFWIHTPGGDVATMFAIYDAMQALRSPVRTVAIGECCSAGVLLLAGGTAGFRYAMPNATVMSHEPEGSFRGNPRAAKARQRSLEWGQERWCELMAKHTPHNAAYWQRTSERKAEYWLLGGEAIREAGLVDHVLQRFADLP